MSIQFHQYPMPKLTCAACAEKIANRMAELSGVHADFNLANGNMTLEAPESYSCLELRNELQEITDRIEPGVQVGACKHERNAPKILHISSLSSNDCAEELVEAIQSLKEIKRASIHFMSQNLYIWPRPNINWTQTYAAIEQLTYQIEPKAHISEDVTYKDENEVHDHKTASIKEIASSFILLIFAVLAPIPPPLDLIIFALAYLIVGREVLLQALQGIRHGDIFNEHFLMSIASLGAFVIGQYPESVAVMLFYNLGEMAQDRAVGQSRQSVEALLDIQPEFAYLIDSTGGTKKLHPNEVAIGDHILIKAGERIPLDGVLIDGSGDLDMSAITGESALKEVSPGDEILSGAINVNGLLTIKVEKAYADSTVSVILDLVERAGSNKAPTERFITRFARYYTPVVVFSALALAILPPLVMGESFNDWIYRGLVFLVASCPCALVLSVPLTFYAGIGSASRNGVLIKGGEFLENLSKTKTFVFDKTGTLTHGEFVVDKVSNYGNLTEDRMLEIIAILESGSNHPIARAFTPYLPEHFSIDNLEEIAGHGLKGQLNGQEYALGNSKLMESLGITLPDLSLPSTTVHLALNGRYQGYVLLKDRVKKEASSALSSLKEMGIHELIMLTGDLKSSGELLAKEIGMDRVYTELLPQEKLEKLILLKEGREGYVAYVGDGINDAPVLTQADVGIAMGAAGSDAAIEAADIVITTDELDRLPKALELSRHTMSVAKQNIFFALSVKAVVLVLGALGLASMWAAVFADVGVAILCVLNAMRLIRR